MGIADHLQDIVLYAQIALPLSLLNSNLGTLVKAKQPVGCAPPCRESVTCLIVEVTYSMLFSLR
jgi:hypothetical protein